MCAFVYSSLLFIFTQIVLFTVLCSRTMLVDGLPLLQERDDPLSGADFLTVFMHHHQALEPSTRQPDLIRATRSSFHPTPPTTLPPSDPGVVLAVHVSSSVGRTLIHKHPYPPPTEPNPAIPDHTLTYAPFTDPSPAFPNTAPTVTDPNPSFTEPNPTFPDSTATDTDPNPTFTDSNPPERSLLASEQHSSLVAEANKSEFSVEEAEPITSNSDFVHAYPAHVRPLARPPPAAFAPPAFAEIDAKPLRQTVIYHSAAEAGRARSVSYSTVIQAAARRQERHYGGGAPAANSYEAPANRTAAKGERGWGRPEQNYEVDESASVGSNGRVHGVQEAKGGERKDDSQKVGYVVEGRNYRKYRVEERTSDGFIVGEYGVVSHDDGSLRGVRYTADGTISPRLIYDALMKFLAL